jgi:asparagine synthase (glutamine-hydrolysing)
VGDLDVPEMAAGFRMSGIFGICEPGREMSRNLLLPMLNAHSLHGETEGELHGSRSIAMGVSRRWKFQQSTISDGLTVVADADLVAFDVLADALSLPVAACFDMGVAELLVRLYLRRGPDFLKILQGGFSLALWDPKEERLLLAIDRMGIKSLYWRKEGDSLLFASRLGGIRAVQSDACTADAAAMLQFLLFSAVPAPLTSDVGTVKLRPGTSISFSSRTIKEEQYWDFEYSEDHDRSVPDWSHRLRGAIRGAVHRHLKGCNQPDTGCYLSGGTDSSSVVAFASERFSPVQSFSIAFEEAGYSEIDYARTTSNAFQTKQYEKFLSPLDASEAVHKIIGYFDEPFANSSAVGSYYCGVLAQQQGVTTLLAGDGGDELFAGNERYAQDKRFGIYQMLPVWLRRGFVEPAVRLLPQGDGKLALPRKYIRRACIPNPRRILSYGFFLSQPPNAVFEDGFLESLGTGDWLAIPEQHFSRARASCELNRILYLDMKMTLADNDLRKVSGTAELAGVNVRYPLLDTQLADISSQIPAQLKLRGFEKRYIFKQAMKDILPSKILRKKKHGFGVPLSHWLLREPRMSELTQDLMRDARTRQRGYFRSSFFDRLPDLHAENSNFYGEIVWYLVALELWHRRHLDHRREAVHAI